MTNQDGLTPDQPVDFETHQRILREKREAKRHVSTAKRAAKAGRRRGKAPMGHLDDSQPEEPSERG